MKRRSDQHLKGPSWSHLCVPTLIKHHQRFSINEFLHKTLEVAHVASTAICVPLSAAVKMSLLTQRRHCTEGGTLRERGRKRDPGLLCNRRITQLTDGGKESDTVIKKDKVVFPLFPVVAELNLWG